MKEEEMKFVMLIYQGTTPLPGTDRWNDLPETDQKAIYADSIEAAIALTTGGTRCRTDETTWGSRSGIAGSSHFPGSSVM